MRDKNFRIHQQIKHQTKQLHLYQIFYNPSKNPNNISAKQMGTFRTRSFNDCGKSHCIFCMNRRRNPLSSGNERITIQERKVNITLAEEKANSYEE